MTKDQLTVGGIKKIGKAKMNCFTNNKLPIEISVIHTNLLRVSKNQYSILSR